MLCPEKFREALAEFDVDDVVTAMIFDGNEKPTLVPSKRKRPFSSKGPCGLSKIPNFCHAKVGDLAILGAKSMYTQWKKELSQLQFSTA